MQLLKHLCPIQQTEIVALYDDGLPLIPPTLYLRSLTAKGLGENTILNQAYAILDFHSYLKHEGILFGETKKSHIIAYKDSLFSRRDANECRLLKNKTIRKYVHIIRMFFEYFSSGFDLTTTYQHPVIEYPALNNPSAFLLSSYDHCWRVHVPLADNHSILRLKGLSQEDFSLVLKVLNKTPYSDEVGEMLYWRDRAIVLFLLMTGLRKGELVRIRIKDLDRKNGFVYLRDRYEDRRLGKLKTGPGEIFVTPTNPYWNPIETWLKKGRPIAQRLLAQQGAPDHGLLFCNQDGSPLTRAAVDHLFENLRVACQFPSDKPFSPHILRHTVASMLLNQGVHILVIQKYLRHKSILSTEKYAKLYPKKTRETLENFWRTHQLW